MRPFPLFGIVFSTISLLLGACAPAGTVGGAPTAPPPATATPVPPDAPAEPDETLAAAPDDWWQLDRTADRFYGISAERAYEEILAQKQPRRTVVVAIIDSGVDIEHEDLDDNIWVNAGEIAGNGRDDDRNGYVDDMHGWNFIGGRDGRNVNQDTYEVTRLYARCQARDASLARDLCREVEQEFQAERAETAELLEQYRNIGNVLRQVIPLLQQQLGTDSLTAERVAALQTTRQDVWRAKQIYLQLASSGVTPEDIEEGVKHFENKLEYGLNPAFDPRPIVGDNYADPNERGYGNNNVEGPDAQHGTHVAGIVAAERNNGIGVDGVAPAVRIMSLRAVPDGDERDKDVANAIRYAVDNGAHIINMSFGKAYSPQKEVVDAAVRYAEQRGVLLVHAAGNDAEDVESEPSFPTRYYSDGTSAQNWIEVGASSWQGSDNLAASFSNYGRRTVDVFAPGVEILSTVPNNEYERLQGTSMAAPVVSGLAAMLMAFYPDLTAAQVRQVILESATRLPEQLVARPGSQDARVRFGELSATGGIVNAFAALRMAEQMSARQ